MTITYTSQPDETSGIDTFIGKNSPTNNYDTSSLLIGHSTDICRALLKFNHSIGINPPPVNAQVLSVTKYIYCLTYTVTRTINIYQCLRNWVENQATWNGYLSGNAWTTAGCAGAGTDYVNTSLGSVSVASTGSKAIVFNAAGIAIVQGMINGTIANYGWLLKDATETTDKNTFADSSDATATRRPKSEIVYQLPSGEVCTFVSGFGVL